MKSFTALSWDGQRCRREIEQLRALLADVSFRVEQSGPVSHAPGG
jgi:hypothetical protein